LSYIEHTNNFVINRGRRMFNQASWIQVKV
jgi:hypothetical protein